MNNGDEYLPLPLKYGGVHSPDVIAIGNFHKTLPHNAFGEVDPAAYERFIEIASGNGNYEHIALGRDQFTTPQPSSDGQAPFPPTIDPPRSDRLNNPQAARGRDKLTGPATDYSMSPAPSVLSRSTAAEMTELQWMALLRDVPFSNWAGHADVARAVTELKTQFQVAVDAKEPGGLRLGQDLPATANGKVDIRPETLFRCGLVDEDKGPIVSQFFLHDIAYGAQLIRQQVRPYAETDFLTDHGTWLRAQSTGYDAMGHGYADDNADVIGPPGSFRHLHSMRDIARFVNKDALHQAYFNAALLCLNWKVPFDSGNPYAGYRRQSMFGSFGGPDLLTRVSEVAGRALAIVWRQKWEVHRRLRPEAYGGLMQMQQNGYDDGSGPVKRAYGLPQMVFATKASQRLMARPAGTLFLPMAFTAGSPPHPSYGAGHATVAGACVTVLKAWLDEKRPLAPLMAAHARHPETDAPVVISETDSSGALIPYADAAVAAQMTVEGELNKLACNVAMGRSMGGVHWRSDNTRSLRLGEQIAAELLRSESMDYAERFTNARAPSWSFTSFNGHPIEIGDGVVRRDGVAVDPKRDLL